MFLHAQGRAFVFIISMTSNFVYLVILIIISGLVARISSRTVDSEELINNIQRPAIQTYSYPAMTKSVHDNSNENDGTFCLIEYQVTRKRTGKCMKLGHDVTGCVSGDYMDPFHPDCF
ncbi:uncharacterized protein LOC143429353 [Xylocopa sonorina]|uniref:uncharacterized protein LOC143429353 n=1 Tax=Xylocopa sonorina TaxID=1818115 RepID=UPI00403A85CD